MEQWEYIVVSVLAVIILVLAVSLYRGKCAWFIAGYNMMSDREKSRYNEKVLCRAVGYFMFVCFAACILSILSELLSAVYLVNIAVVMILGGVIILELWVHFSPKVKRNGNDHVSASQDVTGSGIRRFEIGDLTEVMDLWLNGNLQAHSFIPEAYWKSHYGDVQDAIREAEVYVFETDGHIGGFIGLDGDYIAGVFVREDLRSCGIGSRLLDCAKMERENLTLYVYESNDRAIRFYERKGFTVKREQVDEETGQKELEMSWRHRDS